MCDVGCKPPVPSHCGSVLSTSPTHPLSLSSFKGNHIKTMFLFNALKKDGMSPDAQSYAALLHLCSRTNNAKLAAAMLREMKQKVCGSHAADTPLPH